VEGDLLNPKGKSEEQLKSHRRIYRVLSLRGRTEIVGIKLIVRNNVCKRDYCIIFALTLKPSLRKSYMNASRKSEDAFHTAPRKA